MNRKELVRLVALQAELAPAAADAAVKAVFEEVAGAGRGGAACGVRVVRGEALPGAHGPQSTDRRTHRRAGVARGVVPGRQGAPGRGEPEDRVAGRGAREFRCHGRAAVSREGGLRMTAADRGAGRVLRTGGVALPAAPFPRQ